MASVSPQQPFITPMTHNNHLPTHRSQLSQSFRKELNHLELQSSRKRLATDSPEPHTSLHTTPHTQIPICSSRCFTCSSLQSLRHELDTPNEPVSPHVSLHITTNTPARAHAFASDHVTPSLTQEEINNIHLTLRATANRHTYQQHSIDAHPYFKPKSTPSDMPTHTPDIIDCGCSTSCFRVPPSNSTVSRLTRPQYCATADNTRQPITSTFTINNLEYLGGGALKRKRAVVA